MRPGGRPCSAGRPVTAPLPFPSLLPSQEDEAGGSEEAKEAWVSDQRCGVSLAACCRAAGDGRRAGPASSWAAGGGGAPVRPRGLLGADHAPEGSPAFPVPAHPFLSGECQVLGGVLSAWKE